MKKIILLVIACYAGSAFAADTFSCTYSKAEIINGKLGPMVGASPANVEVTNGAMKAVRPNGSFIYSPPMVDDKSTYWSVSDASKFYVMSQDFKSFAVSDKISKVTEQWAMCELKVASKKTVAEPKHIKTRQLSKVEKNAIESSIRDRLKDPESARFKHSLFISNGNGEYCGLVNSKNSYGGYVGDSPYLVMLVGKGSSVNSAVISFGSEDREQVATIQICKEIGYFR